MKTIKNRKKLSILSALFGLSIIPISGIVLASCSNSKDTWSSNIQSKINQINNVDTNNVEQMSKLQEEHTEIIDKISDSLNEYKTWEEMLKKMIITDKVVGRTSNYQLGEEVTSKNQFDQDILNNINKNILDNSDLHLNLSDWILFEAIFFMYAQYVDAANNGNVNPELLKNFDKLKQFFSNITLTNYYNTVSMKASNYWNNHFLYENLEEIVLFPHYTSKLINTDYHVYVGNINDVTYHLNSIYIANDCFIQWLNSEYHSYEEFNSYKNTNNYKFNNKIKDVLKMSADTFRSIE